MNFTEFFEAYDNESALFEYALDKADIMFEAIEREHDIDLQSCELKVLKESGTVDDIMYLYEAADENKENKFMKTVSFIVDSVLAFFQKITKWFKDLFTSKKTKESLDKLDKAVKENPTLKNQKIQYTDYSKDIKNIDKELAKAESDSRKANAGGEVDVHNYKPLIIGGAVATVTLGSAVALLVKITKDANKAMADSKKSIEDDIRESKNQLKLMKDKGKIDAPKYSNTVEYHKSAIINRKAQLHKLKADAFKQSAASLFQSIKSAVSGPFKKKPKEFIFDSDSEATAESSFVDFDDTADYIMTESFDVDDYLESLEYDIMTESSDNDNPDVTINTKKRKIGKVLAAAGLVIAASAGTFVYGKFMADRVYKEKITKRDKLLKDIKKMEKVIETGNVTVEKYDVMRAKIEQGLSVRPDSRSINELNKIIAGQVQLVGELYQYSEKLEDMLNEVKKLNKDIEKHEMKLQKSQDRKDALLSKVGFGKNKKTNGLVEESYDYDDIDEYLDALESELFDTDGDVLEESYDYDILDDIYDL